MFGIAQLNAMIWPHARRRSRLERLGDRVANLTGIGTPLSQRHPMADFALRSASTTLGLRAMVRGIALGLRTAPLPFAGGLAVPVTTAAIGLAAYSGAWPSISAMRAREHVMFGATLASSIGLGVMVAGPAAGTAVAAVVWGASVAVSGNMLSML